MSGRCDVVEDGRTTIVRIENAAAANALTPAILDELDDALERARTSGTRAVVIRGSGGRFSSGYDLGELADDPAAGRARLAEVLRAIELHPLPVIAVVEGHCVGAGLELALACDFRLAAPDLSMMMPSARLGIVYPPEGVKRLVDAIGAARTRFLMYTGEAVSAETALQFGLVEMVVADDDIESRLRAICRLLDTERAPRSLKGTKETVRLVAEDLSATSMRQHTRLDSLVDRALASTDHAEARRARAERRPPRFSG